MQNVSDISAKGGYSSAVYFSLPYPPQPKADKSGGLKKLGSKSLIDILRKITYYCYRKEQ
ncbi:MAG: hypothetical protein WC727_06565 [Ignavibacteriaceae bacterium]